MSIPRGRHKPSSKNSVLQLASYWGQGNTYLECTVLSVVVGTEEALGAHGAIPGLPLG